MKDIYALPLIFFLYFISPQISFAVEKIIINGLFKDKVIATIDGKQQILKKNKLTPEGLRLIESSSSEATIEIDGIAKVFTLDTKIVNIFKPTSEDKDLSPTITKRAVIKANPNGMYLTKGLINGSSVEFLVDTGATYVSISSGVAKRLRIKYKDGVKIKMETAQGLSTAYEVKLKKVKVGDIELRNIAGVVSDEMPGISLLGMSFLGKLDMKREGKTMTLEK